jgi:hypothetical protein
VPFAGRLHERRVRAVLGEAFRVRRLHRLEANIQPGNADSRALVRGLGFRREGFSPRYLKVCGRWRDHERWALTAEDWHTHSNAGREASCPLAAASDRQPESFAAARTSSARSGHWEHPMVQTTSSSGHVWEHEIRACEEEARIAFLVGDIAALERLWADGYVVNSPLQEVLEKPRLLKLVQAGRIRHTSYEYEIEHIGRHGDVVVVMGRDRVADPPDGVISQRRYTNVWHLEGGRWRSIARHAHVVSREAG